MCQKAADLSHGTTEPFGQNLGRISRTAVLDALGLSTILYSAASLTAISHHTEAVMRSPSGGLKVLEWWMWTQRINPLIAVPRYLAQGATQEPNYDTLNVETNVRAVRG